MSFNSDRGFTLVEVLVALVVFSIGALALANSVSVTANNQRLLEQQTLASIVARNHLNRLRLEPLPSPGNKVSKTEFANQDWQIRTRVTAVEVPVIGNMLRQVQVDIAQGDNQQKSSDQFLFSLRAVIGQN